MQEVLYYTLNYLHQSVLEDNKIPNLNHQITNKSQITIFKGQNAHRSRITLFSKSDSSDDNAIKHRCIRIVVWNFEFRSLGFVWDLDFGAWNFHFFKLSAIPNNIN